MTCNHRQMSWFIFLLDIHHLFARKTVDKAMNVASPRTIVQADIARQFLGHRIVIATTVGVAICHFPKANFTLVSRRPTMPCRDTEMMRTSAWKRPICVAPPEISNSLFRLILTLLDAVSRCETDEF
ncbi:hypothetical protein E2P81_ATG06454 [Venturia nashicola]|uniref:Secreted protein n=1 Tax=Venturia nashicola TaxID=86259 RepID=A0A4Z1NUH8_9PEZI|nr:hypothetical protein E6O75_ATG06615 [Venturia nashicola]TLD28108.1 hypothetical protein E2P81_ATG06454 [Venturia nashicola]